jgi:hypothetical protein
MSIHRCSIFLADHAGQAALTGEDPDSLPDQHLGIPAADAAEPDEAVVVDVVHDKADLVDVPDDRQVRRTLTVHRRVARPERVGGHVRKVGSV